MLRLHIHGVTELTQIRPLILINHRSPEANSGKPTGISNYMLSLTSALLDRDRVDVAMVTSWRREDLPDNIVRRIKSYTQQSLVRPRVLDVMRQALAMPAIARRLGADIILNVDPIGTPRGAKARFTVVHDVYQKMLPEAFSRRERVFNDMIMRMMIVGSSAIVCVSDNTKSDLVRFYPSASTKSRRIYGNSSVGLISTAGGGRSAEKGKHILWVGKITANKNVSLLYRALRILAAEGVEFPAIVVGDDAFGFAEQAERELGQGLPIRRAGRVSDSELLSLYENALCFLNTSTYEGFGMPIIEAQRKGLPVICSSGGALEEIAGSGALIFDPNDPEALARHLQTVINDEHVREQLVATGYDNASRFSWDIAAAEFEELAFSAIAK